MAFADPQTITVNGVAKTLARIEVKGLASVYQTADGLFKFTISHQRTGSGSNVRIRSMIRVDHKAIVPDPLTAVNDYETISTYTVIDRPEVGFTSLEVGYDAAALFAWADSTAIGKVFGLQS